MQGKPTSKFKNLGVVVHCSIKSIKSELSPCKFDN